MERKGPARSPIEQRAPLGQPLALKGSSALCLAGFGVPTAPRRQSSLEARSPALRPALPSPRSLSCPPLPSPPVPAQPRARVCYCEGARGEEGGGAHAGAGACPWAPRRERAVREAGRGRRGGARHPRRPRSGSPARIGSRRRERARARRVVPGGGARAAPPAAAEERREEGGGGAPGGGRGEGGGARPAPCKAALFTWAQPQPPRWEARGGQSSPTGELLSGCGRGGRPGPSAGRGARPGPAGQASTSAASPLRRRPCRAPHDGRTPGEQRGMSQEPGPR